MIAGKGFSAGASGTKFFTVKGSGGFAAKGVNYGKIYH